MSKETSGELNWFALGKLYKSNLKADSHLQKNLFF